MEYICKYESIIGNIFIKSDGKYIVGLCIGDKEEYNTTKELIEESKNIKVLRNAVNWLDIYFSGKEPNELLPLKLEGTAFQKKVWNILTKIPYGKCITYGDIAKKIAQERKIDKMSAQACRKCNWS